MLVIRNSQMQALRDALVREVQAEASALWPADERPSAAELAQAIERAHLYGLVSRPQLERFLALARVEGITFDLAPRRQQVLADGDLSPALKLAVLEESLGARP